MGVAVLLVRVRMGRVRLQGLGFRSILVEVDDIGFSVVEPDDGVADRKRGSGSQLVDTGHVGFSRHLQTPIGLRIMNPTTNPQYRCGLTIWCAGEKAGASRFFHFGRTHGAGDHRATTQNAGVCRWL
jgi:hypothetical protein